MKLIGECDHCKVDDIRPDSCPGYCPAQDGEYPGNCICLTWIVKGVFGICRWEEEMRRQIKKEVVG